MPEPASDPSPLGEATEGFVDLARWFTELVGDQATGVARRFDNGSFDLDAAAAALARTAAMPLLGWASLLNEMFDAAGIVSTPLVRHRSVSSTVFQAPCLGVSRELVLDGPLINGFGDELPPPSRRPGRPGREAGPAAAGPVAVVPATLGPEEAEFTLEAPQVPPECVGVFGGRVAVIPPNPKDCDASERFVDVWLVVP